MRGHPRAQTVEEVPRFWSGGAARLRVALTCLHGSGAGNAGQDGKVTAAGRMYLLTRGPWTGLPDTIPWSCVIFKWEIL